MRRTAQLVLLLFLLNSLAPYALAMASPQPSHCERLGHAQAKSAAPSEAMAAHCHGNMPMAAAPSTTPDESLPAVSAVFQHCPACRLMVGVASSRKGSAALPVSGAAACIAATEASATTSYLFPNLSSGLTLRAGRAPPSQK
jgi:hypothetical protein